MNCAKSSLIVNIYLNTKVYLFIYLFFNCILLRILVWALQTESLSQLAQCAWNWLRENKDIKWVQSEKEGGAEQKSWGSGGKRVDWGLLHHRETCTHSQTHPHQHCPYSKINPSTPDLIFSVWRSPESATPLTNMLWFPWRCGRRFKKLHSNNSH